MSILPESRADIPWPEVVQRLKIENERLERRPGGHSGEYFIVCTLYYTPKESGFTAQRGFPVEFSVRGPHWDKLIELSHGLQEQLRASGLVVDLDSDYRSNPTKAKLEGLVNARVLASQARAQYNEFLYREILALADLERVTAGGFCAGLTPPAASRDQPPPQNDAADNQAALYGIGA